MKSNQNPLPSPANRSARLSKSSMEILQRIIGNMGYLGYIEENREYRVWIMDYRSTEDHGYPAFIADHGES